MTLPDHLGGHASMTNVDAGVLDALVERFEPATFLDIGCGLGGMLHEARLRGLEAKGIDGDYTLDFTGLDVLVHDFTKGPAPLEGEFDLGWCVEVLEHIEEQYLENLKSAFQACKRVWITHALPKQIGHHHVNCQKQSYWINHFRRWGFEAMTGASNLIRSQSTMLDGYARRTGLLLVRK